MAQLATACRK
jgi:hypothetical protein